MLASIVRTTFKFNSASIRALSTTPSRFTGTVKWFDTKKGYGFVSSAEEGDVFVHQSQIHSDGFRSLVEGESVEFDVHFDREKNKKCAERVTAAGGASLQSSRIPRRKPRSLGDRGYGGNDSM